MGGLVAHEVAPRPPDLARRLVLVETGPRGGVDIGNALARVAELFTRKYERQQDMWLPDASHGAHLQYPERFVSHTRMFGDRR